jgi:hypothetical protein
MTGRDTCTLRDEIGTFTDWTSQRSLHWATVILWTGLSAESIITSCGSSSAFGLGLNEVRLELTIILAGYARTTWALIHESWFTTSFNLLAVGSISSAATVTTTEWELKRATEIDTIDQVIIAAWNHKM